jgi:2-hydroxychromene-2-carboxylate isomerase
MASLPASKARMNLLDLSRWAEHLDIPLTIPPSHPQRSVLAMRAILASGDIARAARALYRAYWVDGLAITDEAVVRRVLYAAGLDGAASVRGAEDQAVKDELHARTREAAEVGAFGVPTFVVHRPGREPVFEFGQDRIGFVEELLREVSPPRLEFYFDYSSPFAYLGATQVESLAARHGAVLTYRPFLLGGLFRAIGTPDVPLFAMPPSKQRFMNDDMFRWAKRHGVPLRFPSRFPMNTVAALRMTLSAPGEARGALVAALFRAFWVDDRDISDEGELARIARDVGLDGEALVAETRRPEVKARLRDATEAAEQLGVCGAPCFHAITRQIPEGALFWGQDRLALVERVLDGWRPRSG